MWHGYMTCDTTVRLVSEVIRMIVADKTFHMSQFLINEVVENPFLQFSFTDICHVYTW